MDIKADGILIEIKWNEFLWVPVLSLQGRWWFKRIWDFLWGFKLKAFYGYEQEKLSIFKTFVTKLLISVET